MDNQQSSRITSQGIVFFAILCSVSITFGAFILCRNDHDLKLVALTAVLSMGGTLLGIAGTLVVGAPAYKSITADLPGGSVVKDTTTVQTPPVDPNAVAK